MPLEKPSLAQQLRRVVGNVATDPKRKPASEMLREFTASAWRDREFPRHYFTNMAYRRDAGPAAGYVGRRDRRRIRDRLGTPRDPDLDDKVRFYARAERAGLPIPRILAVIFPDRIELDGRVRPGADPEEIAEVLAEARRLSTHGSIFIKPPNRTSGLGCFRLDADEDDQALLEAAQRIAGGTFIVQQTLRQHPDVERVSPNAVGCLRVHTYRQDGEGRVASLLMRFAVGDAVVDAPSGGALFASVDERTGRVLLPAWTHFQYGGREFERHPATDSPLDIVLPGWPSVLELIDQASGAFNKPFIGWDIAFATEGPVVIEGNNQPDLLLAQVAARGLLNHPGFRPIVEPIVGRRRSATRDV